MKADEVLKHAMDQEPMHIKSISLFRTTVAMSGVVAMGSTMQNTHASSTEPMSLSSCPSHPTAS